MQFSIVYIPYKCHIKTILLTTNFTNIWFKKYYY